MISRPTSEYNEILNQFIDPIPEVSTFEKAELIAQRLTDLKSKADEICGRVKLAKLAYARIGTLTPHQSEMFDRRINGVNQTYETNNSVPQ